MSAIAVQTLRIKGTRSEVDHFVEILESLSEVLSVTTEKAVGADFPGAETFDNDTVLTIAANIDPQALHHLVTNQFIEYTRNRHAHPDR